MPKKCATILLLLAVLYGARSYAQPVPCTTLGQNPSTAFPVCGTSVFYQDSVPLCHSNFLYVPGCSVYGDSSSLYQNRNPYWYKFTCFQSGSLSFVIIPNALGEDYDWQLYDITGHNPDDVYTDTTLIVTGNWSGTPDSTGASAAGVNFIQCASSPPLITPTFAYSPDLIQGHNYLLMVSHFTDTEQGYFLSFGGGTAVITDPVSPHLVNANRASCDGTRLMVKLNKKMKCSSLSLNGSEFSILPAAATVTSATGIGCTNAFDMDSVLLTFSSPLPYNNYQLIVKNGTDANTLLDICDNGIPVGEAIPFTILSPLPVPFDSIRNDHCSSDSLNLVFSFPVKCSSVAADGSDFFITGSYPVGIRDAVPVNCNGGLTRGITVHLSNTITQPGNFQLVLQTGSDGNTLLSECDTPSVAGSALAFRILAKPVPSFAMPASICLPDAAAQFQNQSVISDGTGNLLTYRWDFDDPASGAANQSVLKHPVHIYQHTGPYAIKLSATSNGGCTKDTIELFNNLHPQPKAWFGFDKPAICLGDAIVLSDSGNAGDGITQQWNWHLGDGHTAGTPVLTHVYDSARTYTITLSTSNSFGCLSDTASRSVTVYPYPKVDAGPDRTVLEEMTLQLNAIATGQELSYLWTPPLYLNNTRIPNPRAINIRNSITYTLTVTGAGGCKTPDGVFIKVLKMPVIPNTFTPNNDGINDKWEILYLADYPSNHLQVFTRTGQLVFESSGTYEPWDGTRKGKSLPADTYYYILEPGSGRDPVTGYVTLIK
ncbi:MAG: PKD domain-containing protein [Ferruginibacter sp.]